MVVVLGAEVVDVEHVHGRLEVGIPGGREVHGERQARAGLGGELALQCVHGPVEQGHQGAGGEDLAAPAGAPDS